MKKIILLFCLGFCIGIVQGQDKREKTGLILGGSIAYNSYKYTQTTEYESPPFIIEDYPIGTMTSEIIKNSYLLNPYTGIKISEKSVIGLGFLVRREKEKQTIIVNSKATPLPDFIMNEFGVQLFYRYQIVKSNKIGIYLQPSTQFYSSTTKSSDEDINDSKIKSLIIDLHLAINYSLSKNWNVNISIVNASFIATDYISNFSEKTNQFQISSLFESLQFGIEYRLKRKS